MQIEVIDHISPYKRIELGAKPKKPEPKWVAVDPVVYNPVTLIWTKQIEEIYCG